MPIEEVRNLLPLMVGTGLLLYRNIRMNCKNLLINKSSVIMKLKFALSTWLIASLINAFLSTFYLSDELMHIELSSWWGLFFLSLIVTLFFSIPGFAGIFLWIWVADNFYFSILNKFICFCSGCVLTTILCFGLLSFTLGIAFTDIKIYHLILMSLGSLLAALLLQRKYFYRIITEDFE